MPALHHWLTSHALERLLDLPDPLTRDITVHRDRPIPMPDGVQLLADHYMPRIQDGGPPPTVLVRCPYGRRGAFGLLYGRPLSERGFQVILQSVRGTFGSGGGFVPYAHEREDGLATVRWIREQPWFNGQLATTGISYLGYTQWSIADEAELDAICVQASASDFSARTFDGGSFSLETALGWAQNITFQESGGRLLTMRARRRELRAGLDHLPLDEGDREIAARTIGWYQDWLAHGPRDEFWRSKSHTERLAKIGAPITMRAGWYDIFLPWQLSDHALLTEAGNQPRLVIGPWSHSAPGMLRGIGRDTVEFLNEQLLGQPAARQSPVRYFVTGTDEWRESATWPPRGAQAQSWALRAAGGLEPGDGSDAPDVPGRPTRFRYDPADPTPSVGGPHLSDRQPMRDNRDLEARPDVLVFTSTPLRSPVDIAGTPVARITVSSDNPCHDLFVRLCDVHPDGTSMNVCDRLIRLDPQAADRRADGFTVDTVEDGARVATVSLWPAAHQFRAGHRIRVQISGGAHPRFARNPGTGDPLASARTLVPVEVSVHHDAVRRSVLTLPVLP